MTAVHAFSEWSDLYFRTRGTQYTAGMSMQVLCKPLNGLGALTASHDDPHYI